MKKNRSLFITTLICILLILCFWTLKQNQSSEIIKKPIPIENKNNLSNPILIDTSANLKSNANSNTQIPNPDNEQKLEKKYSEEECWEIVKKQYVSNPTYIKTHLSLFNSIIGQWFYSKNEVPIQQENSISGKFLLALGRAGLLEGKKFKKIFLKPLNF